MASKRDRLRKLERARTERRLARQAASQRRKRQTQAAVGASVAIVLIVFGTLWVVGVFEPEPKPTVASGTCTWNLRDPAADPDVVDVGHPPTTGEQRQGTEKMTIQTSLGTIEAELDLVRAPCTAASFAYLAEKKFYDGKTCHRVSTDLFILQCGAPNPTGSGRLSYSFDDENLPAAADADPTASASAAAGATGPSVSASPGTSPSPAAPNLYPKGTIAMVNEGAGTNDSQFYIFYTDGSTLPAAYSIVGKVTKGLGIVENVAKAGAVDSNGTDVADGTPKTPVVIQSLWLGSTPPAQTPGSTPLTTPTPTGTP